MIGRRSADQGRRQGRRNDARNGVKIVQLGPSVAPKLNEMYNEGILQTASRTTPDDVKALWELAKSQEHAQPVDPESGAAARCRGAGCDGTARSARQGREWRRCASRSWRFLHGRSRRPLFLFGAAQLVRRPQRLPAVRQRVPRAAEGDRRSRATSRCRYLLEVLRRTDTRATCARSGASPLWSAPSSPISSRSKAFGSSTSTF